MPDHSLLLLKLLSLFMSPVYYLSAAHVRMANLGKVAALMSHTSIHTLCRFPFRRDRPWRGAGLAVPVFSIRTRDSVGCGEFMDLIKLVDLAHE